jgi:hypothetical protein
VTDDYDDAEPAEYGLVMPFVVCDDQDGPYVAQWRQVEAWARENGIPTR